MATNESVEKKFLGVQGVERLIQNVKSEIPDMTPYATREEVQALIDEIASALEAL